MSWKGLAIGGSIGWFVGGPLGALLGAAFGQHLEHEMTKKGTPRTRRTANVPPDRSMVFCASAAAMLAKLAKADGQVTRNEIAAVEAAFSRLGFRAGARAYAISVFRKAKDDSHSIYEYAQEFAAAVPSLEIRELFYGLLWDLARADGRVGPAERRILHDIPMALRIRVGWFHVYDEPETPRNALADAYATLGVEAGASDEDVKRAYREKAKKCHPDVLRAQGLPDEMIGRATEQMKRVNAAWAAIRNARGI